MHQPQTDSVTFRDFMRILDSMCLEVFVWGRPEDVLLMVTLQEDHIQKMVVLDD
jgi:hypothetical protein